MFEQNAVVGSFLVKYPRHGVLISLNKRNTGRDRPEFNMRHDWNSLLDLILLCMNLISLSRYLVLCWSNYARNYASSFCSIAYSTSITTRTMMMMSYLSTSIRSTAYWKLSPMLVTCYIISCTDHSS